MKKLFIFLPLLVPCLSLSSLELGVAADVSFQKDSAKQDTVSASLIDAELLPALVLMIFFWKPVLHTLLSYFNFFC